MRTVNIHEAKTHLSRLLQSVSDGEEIVIAKAGKPIARLVPHEIKGALRTPGALRKRIWIADDFDEPLPPPLVAAFRGETP